MKKIDLVNCLVDGIKETEFAEKLEGKSFSKKDATEIVDLLFDAMQVGLKGDGMLDIYGFFKMIVEEKEARNGRNPKTGQDMVIPAKKAIKCKFSKTIKDYINE